MGNISVEQKAKIKHQGLSEISMLSGEGDLTVDIAFGKPFHVSTETKTNSCVPKKDGCAQYYYNVKYRMPAIVQVRKGDEVINSWELDPMMDLKFGNEQVETHQTIDGGSKTTVRIIQYKSEEDLALAFASHGEDELARKGILVQLSQMADIIYDNVFFSEATMKMDLAYGSGKATDYSVLENTAQKAVEIIESGNYEDLNSLIPQWQEWLAKYEPGNKKAAVTKKIAIGLHQNLAISHCFTKSFDDAIKHIDEAILLANEGNKNLNTIRELEELRAFILKQEGANKYNASVKPEGLVQAPNIKKLIGKRKLNENMKIFISEEKYDSFKQAMN